MTSTNYVELHCCSAFSFLEGSSTPEELAQEAARLGYSSVALLDRNGVYGAPRFFKACQEKGIRPLVGSEIIVPGGRLALLVENRTGYQNLCRLITNAKLRSKKDQEIICLEELEEFSEGLICLTGGIQSPLKKMQFPDLEQGIAYLEKLYSYFPPGNLYIELQRHLNREQEHYNQFLIELSSKTRTPLMITNGVRYARPEGRLLLDVLTCIRHRTTLMEAGKLLNQNNECHFKSPKAMQKLFADLPQAFHNTLELGERINFTLEDLGYRFPNYPVPPGENMNSYLRKLVDAGARQRYRPYSRQVRQQLEKELRIIEKLQLAGYFLVVWDIVQFCRKKDILVQGRGSAANSAVCYSLGITAVDPVGMDLLFERFLSEERGEWPDIDLDLPSGDRREEVIQYVYERYGRRGAAMTANVITYRARSAAREVGKSLGFPPQMLDRLSRLLMTWGLFSMHEEKVILERFREAGLNLHNHRALKFVQLWKQIQDLPRHLGQHSGGMVICQERLDSIVPLENARMLGRTVVQWDKEDCADLGIIKVDLLGLGMMSALQDSIRLIEQSGKKVDLAQLPQDDPQVYDLLQKADTIGVFQVESRAQMATLPRLKPERFYDLVIEVAIIRPGPIVGEMVHPYLRRKAGKEPVSYSHPSLEPILKRTLGVPLFQEQLLKIAMVAAGFTGGEAEELRRALGFKRPEGAMEKIEIRLREGLKKNGITGSSADTIVRYITSFALYGFPESHAASFALLAYASAYIKTHFPAEFYTALLNNQPMGFYHPATLVKDAQHRNQKVRPVDIQHSNWECTIEKDGAIRLGLRYVKGFRKSTADILVRERSRALFQSLQDFQQRVPVDRSEMVTLAQIGALNSLGMKRREALWQVEKLSRSAGPLFSKGDSAENDPSPLKEMNQVERLIADYAGSSLTTGPHPMALKRKDLNKKGVVPACFLKTIPSGKTIRIGGSVIVRQRPSTANGFLFVSLEDETGISNAVIRPFLFEKFRVQLINSPFLIIEGKLQNQDDVVSVRAERVWTLDAFKIDIPSHDFG